MEVKISDEEQELYLQREEEVPFDEAVGLSSGASGAAALESYWLDKKKRKKEKKRKPLEEVLEEVIRQETEDGIMPPWKQDGLQENLDGFDISTLVHSDAAYNKELSWLAFNWRVLHMALDPRTPLFERVKFLAITARNLDEFFCKRVGALKRQEAAGIENLVADHQQLSWTPAHQLNLVAREVEGMVLTQMQCLQAVLLPSLRQEGIFVLDWGELDQEQHADLKAYFRAKLEPILTPLAVDPGHPFPFIGNYTLSIAVALRDPVDGDDEFAIVNVPSSCPRWISLAFDDDDEHLRNSFVAVEQIIRANLYRVFGGMEILSAHFFRVTRNADVARNEEEAEDLLEMINDEMRERKFAPFVRLEVECGMPEDVLQKLTSELGLSNTNDVFEVCGLLALGELDAMPVKLGRDSALQFPPWTPQTHPRFQHGQNVFEVIRAGDVLVHHPYHSFGTSVQYFVESAARDPMVRAIKATLYRTSSDSPVISALMKAAEAGKQVAVLVELKARFDEARNVAFAQKLEEAGCNVAYGLVGLKTHCKCIMVVREEEGGFRIYTHIGTGNYNPRTANVYTDFGLFSCRTELGEDVADLFKYLTGYHRQSKFNKLLIAPGTMRREFIRLIDWEIANANAGLPASVIVKCNGLDDQVMVSKLYEAAKAGVKVTCIVRGMCRLRPGVAGISENIQVISIIGRFLEHHRIFRFENGGSPRYFIGSADWMSRNLTRRVEVVTPIEDPSLKQELQDIIEACVIDRRQAWELQEDGRYRLLGVGLDLAAPSPATELGRLSRAETAGLHQALMDYTLRQSMVAKKVRMKKTDSRTPKIRRRQLESNYDANLSS
eukprot:TRINITY_DN13853_c0_g1_i1.p1 TRINITY_DN13853_c0_g1~~TRINITY_DN13853_c0_g1_i1.p1  ORF type:complete len:925 (+),score=264.64 TRINITY_DN13853_c0_g1_i1:272-2776(+)